MVATFNDSLKRVTVNNNDGKTENSSASRVYIETSNITNAMHKFRVSSRSINTVGSGRIITIRMPTTPRMMIRSRCLASDFTTGEFNAYDNDDVTFEEFMVSSPYR